MKTIIISIGNEITSGHTINTNASWMAQELESIGITPDKVVTLRDNVKTLAGEIRSALKKFNLILITGGLGPTSDDVTKLALVKVFNTSLVRDKKTLAGVKRFFNKINRPMAPINEGQADVPEGSEVIRNRWGTAPCLGFSGDGFLLYSLPGVPYEMKNLMTHEILKRVKKAAPKSAIVRSTIRTIGIGESNLFTLIENAGGIDSSIELAYLPHFGQVDLRLTVTDRARATARKKLNAARKRLLEIVGPYHFSNDDESIEVTIGKMLMGKGLTMASAESCTGGLFASRITSVSGSSAYFLEGVVTYTNEAKMSRLDVAEATLIEFGAVSAQTASEMAQGIQKTSGADIGLSATGIAGPTGGTKEKPVGLIYVALAMNGEVETLALSLGMDRNRNQEWTTREMLTMLWRAIKEMP